ncbi:putative bifunctional diguanylate cyclase/phosphodiesterase [Coralloluteibacterium stylophorae]|uniref:EAL domain-containing protein n=2 Tax=Coralloluteibacterium stylophorae TaxID=1776034 RepID=A0AAP2G0B1_9GAMM|nr:EAL domain-containing protein [Coralloluteibacterium stylophorae]MBS7457605.1 EAL domain-containing protein [Coralloluteibacterium stylophorae]
MIGAERHAALARALPRLSFHGKLLALLAGLVVAAQLATFGVVRFAVDRSVDLQLGRQLEVGERVWLQIDAARADQLLGFVQVLADDYGFRQAVASGDAATIDSALANQAQRIDADMAWLLAPDGSLRAGLDVTGADALETVLRPLVERARQDGVATGVVRIGSRPFQVALVPVLAPAHIAWAVVGVDFGSAYVREFQAITGLDASILVADANAPPRLHASSLGSEADGRGPETTQDGVVRALGADETGPGVQVVLRASHSDALAPYRSLALTILLLSAVAAAIALVVAGAIGRNVTRPISRLAGAARRIEGGDYSRSVEVRGGDEVAALAGSFNRMQAAIAQREARILHQAQHDGLTGLANRVRARAELERLIAEARAGEGGCAVLVLNLDRFKEINDAFGHAFGDGVLVEVARRLGDALMPGDLVARLDGDEFLALLADCDGAAAMARAQRLLDALDTPLELPESEVAVTASAGLAVYPEHAQEPSSLMRRADIAMHEAKRDRSGLEVYIAGRDEQHLRRLGLIAALRDAIARDELTVNFQPKVDIPSGRVRHAEVLVRWTSGTYGWVGPDEFIPLAEQSGLIHALTRHVLDAALATLRGWCDRGLDLAVAVNLSAVDLVDASLPVWIASRLAHHGLGAERLILEVTETSVMRDVDAAVALLHRLRGAGIRLAIDDFGTGQSSLAQLKRLPVDELKIDKSFVMRLGEAGDDAIIVRSTIEIGHNMGLKVVAEGVETPAGLEALRAMRCDMAQGYLFSRPLPAAAFEQWCRAFAATETTT